jgi:hypothetical protein
VIDGTLSFRDGTHFRETLERIKKMSIEDYDKWEEEIGFVSLETNFNKVQQQLCDSKTVKEYNDIIAKNDDIIEVQYDVPTQKNHFRTLNRVLDRAGNLYVENILYNYSDKGEVIIKSGAKELLPVAFAIKKHDESQGIIYFSLTTDNARAACGNYQTTSYTNSAANRKAVVEAVINRYAWVNTTISTPNNNFYFVQCSSTTVGTPYKTNLFNKWVTYSTANNLTSNFGVVAYDFTYSALLTSPNFSHTYTNNWDRIDDGATHLNLNNVPQSSVGGADIYFSYMNVVKYGHQGTNGNFATIQCQ